MRGGLLPARELGRRNGGLLGCSGDGAFDSYGACLRDKRAHPRPLQDHSAPGEAAAEAGQGHALALPEAPLLPGLAQGDGH